MALAKSNKLVSMQCFFVQCVQFELILKNDNALIACEAAAWLAQLVEGQSAMREVEGSSPRPDQHSGS